MTQKEEEEERLKIKNSIFSIDLNMNIPYINQIRQNNLDKYKSFHPLINDIYKNVLNFNRIYKIAFFFATKRIFLDKFSSSSQNMFRNDPRKYL